MDHLWLAQKSNDVLDQSGKPNYRSTSLMILLVLNPPHTFCCWNLRVHRLPTVFVRLAPPRRRILVWNSVDVSIYVRLHIIRVPNCPRANKDNLYLNSCPISDDKYIKSACFVSLGWLHWEHLWASEQPDKQGRLAQVSVQFWASTMQTWVGRLRPIHQLCKSISFLSSLHNKQTLTRMLNSE